MPHVTKYNFFMEKHLIPVMDSLINRCDGDKGPKLDTFILVEGQEGTGKTTFSILLGYYIAYKTGRPFSAENLFFDIEELIKFAQENTKQIIIWDEPALQMLSTDYRNKVSVSFKRLMMMARKQRHFIMVNVTYFYRFDSYILDRCNGMVRVYRNQGKNESRFRWFKEKKARQLFEDYITKRKKMYNKYGSKFVRGSFPDILSPKHKNNVLADWDNDLYEHNKDEAIKKITPKPKEVLSQSNKRFKRYIVRLAMSLNLQQKEVAERLGLSPSSVNEWFVKEEQEEKHALLPKYASNNE